MAKAGASVSFDDAVEVIQDLAIAFRSATGRPLRSIVSVGGTALAAHAVRDTSEDVDVYVSEVDDAVLETVTKKHAARFGPRFKIDATPSNTLWGAIGIPDIESSPVVRDTDGRDGIAVRALSVETLYIVKSAADREKDQSDIRALAMHTTYAATLARARELFPWYVDRSTLPVHVERLARYMARDHAVPLAEVERDFALPEVTAGKVREIRRGMEAQFTYILRGLMRQYPELISFTPEAPDIVRFDAGAARAGDEVLAVARNDPRLVSDLAAVVLKAADPARHAQRLLAIRNRRMADR